MPENACVFQGSRCIVVPQSRRPVVSLSRYPAVPDSVWVGKNLPAKREGDPQSEGRRVVLGRGCAVSRFCWRATQAFSAILRCSQSFPVNCAPLVAPYRLAVLSSRCPAVPDSVWVGKNLPAKREDDPQSERATRKVGGVRCFLRGKSVRRPAK